MQLETFHGKLYGTGGGCELNEVHREVYAKIDEGYHGVYSDPRDFDRLLAALTVALWNTHFPSEGQATLILTAASESWALRQLQQVWTNLLKARKHLGRKGNQPLIDAMYRVYTGARPLTMATPPSRWVAFGFQENTVVPAWMEGTLT